MLHPFSKTGYGMKVMFMLKFSRFIVFLKIIYYATFDMRIVYTRILEKFDWEYIFSDSIYGISRFIPNALLNVTALCKFLLP